MQYTNPWIYNDKPLTTEDVQDYVGMVYLLVNTATDRSYVGKKFFWKPKKKKVKGRTRRTITESDWKSYYGSSKELQADIEQHGTDVIERHVLYLCKSKTQCAYYELKEQVDREVLLRDDYYNGFVGGKISGRNLKRLEE